MFLSLEQLKTLLRFYRQLKHHKGIDILLSKIDYFDEQDQIFSSNPDDNDGDVLYLLVKEPLILKPTATVKETVTTESQDRDHLR